MTKTIFNKAVVIILLLLQTPIMAQKEKKLLNLMPWPKEVKLQEGTFTISKDFSINISGNYNDRILHASNRFLRRLDGRTGLFFNQTIIQSKKDLVVNAPLQITIERPGKIQLNEDESYTLLVEANSIQLKAVTDIGALRGLETLLQLLEISNEGFGFPIISIKDEPRFPWRGLMIDAARHFQPINVIERNLDAMAAVKLNIFHWHLSDDQGFRAEIKSWPKLHNEASDGQYYTQAQMKHIVAYAAQHGIMVIPEIDVPGHGTAILTAYPEIASMPQEYTLERNAGIFKPTLDPTNPQTYKILTGIFKELADIFPSKYVHIGGDENEGKHWDANPNIVAFKKQHNLKTNHDLQTYFNIKLEKILKGFGKSLMGWEEIMTPNMPTSALIHSWRGVNEGVPAKQSLVNAAKKGYKTVLSNGYYIDLLYNIEDHYLVDPMPDATLTQEEQEHILGGEATMWGELVTPLTIDSRIWPRTAAIAERFWSPKHITDIDNMRKRLRQVSFRLEELGLTHIKNRDVILRNITNNQSIKPLKNLIAICEPLKGYTRNAGGTEYQSYSPFTLFADACIADADDAYYFKKAVNAFLENKTVLNTAELAHYLQKWIENHSGFKQLEENPILKQLKPLSENLAIAASILKKLIETNTISKTDKKELTKALIELEKDYLDTEVAIQPELERLVNNLLKEATN